MSCLLRSSAPKRETEGHFCWTGCWSAISARGKVRRHIRSMEAKAKPMGLSVTG